MKLIKKYPVITCGIVLVILLVFIFLCNCTRSKSEEISGVVSGFDYVPSTTIVKGSQIIYVTPERYLVYVRIDNGRKEIPIDNLSLYLISDYGYIIKLEQKKKKNFFGYGYPIQEEFILLDEEPIEGPIDGPLQEF